MHVETENWSVPEPGDPPPCFRQGDLVRLPWVRPDITVADAGSTIRVSSFEIRTEIVALLSACCDLVVRAPPKRKGVLISPLRPVPKNISKNPELILALKASTSEALAKELNVPANLFFFAAHGDSVEGVVFLESISCIEFPLLQRGRKVAELTEDARADLHERIKWHFTRSEA